MNLGQEKTERNANVQNKANNHCAKVWNLRHFLALDTCKHYYYAVFPYY